MIKRTQLRTCGPMYTTEVMLTTSNRLNAEPASKIAPGDLGVRYTEDPGAAPSSPLQTPLRAASASA